MLFMQIVGYLLFFVYNVGIDWIQMRQIIGN